MMVEVKAETNALRFEKMVWAKALRWERTQHDNDIVTSYR